MESRTLIIFTPEGETIFRDGHFTACYTKSECIAQQILGKGLNSTSSSYTPHDAGNEIIELAEKIKSERAIMAMKG